jgi:manganese efflux pump family protein
MGVVELYLVAVAISLDTFAASLALGTRTPPSGWIRVAVVFALSGGIFPLVGMGVGVLASGILAQAAQLLGVVVLGGLGIWFLVTAWRSPAYPSGQRPAPPRGGRGSVLSLGSLVLLSFGLSSDNLLVGLGLGLQGGATLVLGFITGVSVFGASITGLWLGRLKVSWFGRGAQALAGLLLLGLALFFLLGLTGREAG